MGSPKEALNFARTLRRKTRLFPGVEVVIAPSFTLLPSVALALKGSVLKVGAQSVSPYTDSKRTGEVSAAMLKLAGATHVIVGHSERRAEGEDDEVINAQLQNVVAQNLSPILCVGEEERTQDGAHFATIEKQLGGALKGIKNIPGLVVAYEPVWAIGKSAAEALDAQSLTEMVIFIRKTLADLLDRKEALKVPILYGGSVEPENTVKLLKDGGVSGFLVGHASSELDSFVEILKACKR